MPTFGGLRLIFGGLGVEFEVQSGNFLSLGGNLWLLGAHHASFGRYFGSQEVQNDNFPSPGERKVRLFRAFRRPWGVFGEVLGRIWGSLGAHLGDLQAHFSGSGHNFGGFSAKIVIFTKT